MSHDEGPWYKQVWFWMIMAPLLVVIVASFNLLYLAITTSDGVVADDYYKEGRGIIARNDEDAFARSQGLTANLTVRENNQLFLKLGGRLAPPPEQLELHLIFPTSKNFDIDVVLNHQGRGEYIGALPETVVGRRQLLLQPVNQQVGWRLYFDGELPAIDSSLTLSPRPE